MKIKFLGAAQTVTGSKHLITLWDNETILLDCGMFQGLGKDTLEWNMNLGFDPRDIDHCILSHAHIDHSGLIPKLVAGGYEGKIYCTPATFDLCKIMLMDSAYIQEADVKFVNKRRKKKKLPAIEPLYTKGDVEKCLNQFKVIDYDVEYEINNHIQLQFTDNGHILGSATTNLEIREVNETTRVCYTGDVGRYGTALMRDPSPFPQADVIICESTYGDRLHSSDTDTEQQVLDAVNNTIGLKKGKLIIPAFSLGRTQEIVYALHKLYKHGLIPGVKIFVDSPLAVNATKIMRDYVHSLNSSVQRFVESSPDPFGFDTLTYIRDKRESQKLNGLKEPCIIISAAGMAEAGRVKHHIMHNIGQPENTIMIVGYAEPLSLAGRLRRGDEIVKIYGDDYPVIADVMVIDSLSAHADYEGLIHYLSCQDKEKVSKFFVVHGEEQSQIAFKKHLKEVGFNNIFIPEKGEEIDI